MSVVKDHRDHCPLSWTLRRTFLAITWGEASTPLPSMTLCTSGFPLRGDVLQQCVIVLTLSAEVINNISLLNTSCPRWVLALAHEDFLLIEALDKITLVSSFLHCCFCPFILHMSVCWSPSWECQRTSSPQNVITGFIRLCFVPTHQDQDNLFCSYFRMSSFVHIFFLIYLFELNVLKWSLHIFVYACTHSQWIASLPWNVSQQPGVMLKLVTHQIRD